MKRLVCCPPTVSVKLASQQNLPKQNLEEPHSSFLIWGEGQLVCVYVVHAYMHTCKSVDALVCVYVAVLVYIIECMAKFNTSCLSALFSTLYIEAIATRLLT